MKRSLLLLVTFCLLAFAFCIDFGAAAVSKATGFARAAVSLVSDFVLKTFSGPAPLAVAPDVLPGRRIEQAEAFVRRLAKRERPLVSPGWRMAPSI